MSDDEVNIDTDLPTIKRYQVKLEADVGAKRELDPSPHIKVLQIIGNYITKLLKLMVLFKAM